MTGVYVRRSNGQEQRRLSSVDQAIVGEGESVASSTYKAANTRPIL